MPGGPRQRELAGGSGRRPVPGGRPPTTVNDVVLAVLAGALRTWLLTRGEPVPPKSVVRALVPMSVRVDDPSQAGAVGSRVASLLVDLPTGEPSPLMRLHQISYQTKAHREAGQAVDAPAIAGIAGFAPPTLHSLGARVASGLSRRMFNLVITNVPGPQQPLYLLGARMLASYPVIPLARGQALSIGLTSYDGGVYYGLNGDRDAMPDLDVLGTVHHRRPRRDGGGRPVSGRWGLVLGGGGVLGGAWMVGALTALEQVHGLDARDADVIVGHVGRFADRRPARGRGVHRPAACPPARGPSSRRAGSAGSTGTTTPRPAVSTPPRPRPAAGNAAAWSPTTSTGCAGCRRPPSWPRWCPRGAVRSAAVGRLVGALVPSGWAPASRGARGGDGLRVGTADGVRGPGGAGGRPRRRGDGLVRHPRLVRPGGDRRAPVRRRRCLLGDQRRPGRRSGAGARCSCWRRWCRSRWTIRRTGGPGPSDSGGPG